MKSGGSGRGLFIQGIKFYTSKSIDDIFQKFDRSLRPFPGEKFAKQKDLSNARIANQESYNYLQTIFMPEYRNYVSLHTLYFAKNKNLIKVQMGIQKKIPQE